MHVARFPFQVLYLLQATHPTHSSYLLYLLYLHITYFLPSPLATYQPGLTTVPTVPTFYKPYHNVYLPDLLPLKNLTRCAPVEVENLAGVAESFFCDKNLGSRLCR